MSIASHMAGLAGGLTGMKSPAKPHEATSGEGERGPAEHLQELHAKMGGKHMHVHSDGIEHTSHQIGEEGEVEGPHNHENIEALKSHMGKFLNEEEHEGGYEHEKPHHGGKESLFSE